MAQRRKSVDVATVKEGEILCEKCQVPVNEKLITSHLYSKHMQMKALSCRHCAFQLGFSTVQMEAHVRATHPDVVDVAAAYSNRKAEPNFVSYAALLRSEYFKPPKKAKKTPLKAQGGDVTSKEVMTSSAGVVTTPATPSDGVDAGALEETSKTTSQSSVGVTDTPPIKRKTRVSIVTPPAAKDDDAEPTPPPPPPPAKRGRKPATPKAANSSATPATTPPATKDDDAAPTPPPPAKRGRKPATQKAATPATENDNSTPFSKENTETPESITTPTPAKRGRKTTPKTAANSSPAIATTPAAENDSMPAEQNSVLQPISTTTPTPAKRGRKATSKAAVKASPAPSVPVESDNPSESPAPKSATPVSKRKPKATATAKATPEASSPPAPTTTKIKATPKTAKKTSPAAEPVSTEPEEPTSETAPTTAEGKTPKRKALLKKVQPNSDKKAALVVAPVVAIDNTTKDASLKKKATLACERTCKECQEPVSVKMITSHVYSRHMHEKALSCNYCLFKLGYSLAQMKAHVETKHKGVDMKYAFVNRRNEPAFVEYAAKLREQLFGDLSAEGSAVPVGSNVGASPDFAFVIDQMDTNAANEE